MQEQALYMKRRRGHLDMIILMNGVLGYLDGHFKISCYIMGDQLIAVLLADSGLCQCSGSIFCFDKHMLSLLL